MKYKYPDFSKYFENEQLLPTEILMIIHDYNRSKIKQQALLISNTRKFIKAPPEENTYFLITPTTDLSISSYPHSPFKEVSYPYGTYQEYHHENSMSVRRVFRNDDFKIIRIELLFTNAQYILPLNF